MGAVEPISAGRVLVDEQANTRTAIALVNPSSQPLTVTLTIRDSNGAQVDQIERAFAAGEHQALFVDQLFSDLGDFLGTLTFEPAQPAQTLAAITLRENKNVNGEEVFATLPVANLSASGNGSLVLGFRQ